MPLEVRKLRVAVNGRLFVGQALEGVGRYALEVTAELMRGLPEADFLLLADRAGPLPELPRAPERRTLYPSARHPVLFYAWFELAVPRALRAWRADVFVSLDNFCSLRTDIPTVLAVHDLAYRHYPTGVSRVQLAFYRRFTPRYVRRAEAVLAVSEYTRQDLLEAFDLPPEKITVAPNGVRPRFGRLAPKHVTQVRDGLTGGAPYFIAVGSVHPRKNVDGLIRAFDLFRANAPDDPTHLVIAGRLAWRTEAVEAALAASPHRSRIHVTGFVSDERLGELIGAALALCLVSRFEGFGVPILEAYACGLPVVVADRSSLPEVAGPGGLTVDPDDDADIARALERLARDGDLRAVLAQAGHRHAERYSWSRTGDIVAEVIRNLATRDSPLSSSARVP